MSERHVVTIDAREVRLTAKEFLLLQDPIRRTGAACSCDSLSDVWDYSYTGGTRTVDVHVAACARSFLVEALVTVKQFATSCSSCRPWQRRRCPWSASPDD